MKKQVFTHMTVTVIADTNEQKIQPSKLTPAHVLLKQPNEMVVMPVDINSYKHATPNPLLYEGKFFSSRQKQNGCISLHGIIRSKKDLCQAYNTARQELDEFFAKMEALL